MNEWGDKYVNREFAPPRRQAYGRAGKKGATFPAPQHHVPRAPFWSPTPSCGVNFTHQSHKHLSVIFSQGLEPCSRIPRLCDLGQFMEPLCAFISPPVTWGK